MSQEAAATRLGITRFQLNDLMRGKLGNSRSMPGNLTSAAGLVV